MSKKFQGIFIRLKPDQHEKLVEIQQKEGITLAAQVRQAVGIYLRKRA